MIVITLRREKENLHKINFLAFSHLIAPFKADEMTSELKFFRFLLTVLIFSQTNADHYTGFIEGIKYGESAAGNLVFMGWGYKWSTCQKKCTDENAGYDAVTLSNVGECYCSSNSIRVANQSRIMSFMTGATNTDLNGGWGAWVPSGDCWPPCGKGTQTRTRSCIFPDNINYGASCSGSTSSTTFCFNRCVPYATITPDTSSRVLLPGQAVVTNVKIPYVTYGTGSGMTKIHSFGMTTSTNRQVFKVEVATDMSYGSVITHTINDDETKVDKVKGDKAFDNYQQLHFSNFGTYTSSSETTYYEFSCNIKMHLMDIPDFDDGTTQFHSNFILYLSDKYIHVQKEFFTKQHNSADEGDVQFVFHRWSWAGINPVGVSTYVPIELKSSVVIQQSTNIEIRFHLPSTMAESSRLSFSSSNDMQSYTTFSYDRPTNIFKMRVTHLDIKANQVFYVYFRVAATDYTKAEYLGNSKQMRIHVTYNYCPYDACDSTKQLKSGNDVMFLDYMSPFYPTNKHMRVKYVNDGRCISKPDSSGFYSMKSTCDVEFQFAPNFMEVGNSQQKDGFAGHFTTVVGETVIAYQPYDFFPSNQFFIIPTRNTFCLFHCKTNYAKGSAVQSDGGRIFRSSEDADYGFYTEVDKTKCSSNRSSIKVLEGWPRLSQVMLRSMIKISVPVHGEQFVVCNPTGDLGNKRNCYYTLNRGTSWTGISSLVTHFTFYVSSVSSFYGYCNRRKYPCKLQYTETGSIMLKMVTSAEYQTNSLRVDSQLVENFDGIDYDSNVLVSQSDPLVGVNSIGLHSRTSESANWTPIFIWSE